MNVELLVESGPYKGRALILDRPGAYVIGRAPDADLALPEDRYISRRHCVVALEADGVWIHDAGSRSGTFVNGRHIAGKIRLLTGDRVRVGRSALCISVEGSEGTAETLEENAGVAGFTLVRRLPGDGLGEPWLAVAQGARPVTLYRLPIDDSDQQTLNRFQREAAILATLEHDHLTRFIGQGVDGHTLWFATEVVEGESLRQWVRRQGPFAVDQALDFVAQALDVLAYLHEKDVVHRCLRPESFLLTRQGGALRLRLADLSSARHFSELQRLTATGERGYPINAFTAPEALVNAHSLDPRSDVYALGAILYFALSGRDPYEVAGAEALAATILNSAPTPLQTLRPGLPPPLVAAVGRAMAREPEARYSTVRQLREALFPHVRHGPAGAPAPAATLEIWLRRDERASHSYRAVVTFRPAGSPADEELVADESSLIVLDPTPLLERALDPAEYGAALSDMLFADQRLLRAFVAASSRAAGAEVSLRIRLRLDSADPAIHALRWELLRDPAAPERPFVCTSANRPFSRYLASRDPTPVHRGSRAAPSVLVAVAAPTDLQTRYGISAIERTRALAALEPALRGARTTYLPQATLPAIVAGLLDAPDVLYLVCHGRLVSGQPHLWLEHEQGMSAPLDGAVLVERVQGLARRPALIVLATCDSAGQSHIHGSALAAIGPRLAQAGVGAVLAMHDTIAAATVQAGMPTFFAELRRHGQVDLAVAAMRNLLATHGDDWWQPVLFLRLADGVILM